MDKNKNIYNYWRSQENNLLNQEFLTFNKLNTIHRFDYNLLFNYAELFAKNAFGSENFNKFSLNKLAVAFIKTLKTQALTEIPIFLDSRDSNLFNPFCLRLQSELKLPLYRLEGEINYQKFLTSKAIPFAIIITSHRGYSKIVLYGEDNQVKFLVLDAINKLQLDNNLYLEQLDKYLQSGELVFSKIEKKYQSNPKQVVANGLVDKEIFVTAPKFFEKNLLALKYPKLIIKNRDAVFLGNFYDVDNYQDIYQLLQRRHAKYVINISPGATNVSLGIKVNRNWKFLNYYELYVYFLAYKKQQKQLVVNRNSSDGIIQKLNNHYVPKKANDKLSATKINCDLTPNFTYRLDPTQKFPDISFIVKTIIEMINFYPDLFLAIKQFQSEFGFYRIEQERLKISTKQEFKAKNTYIKKAKTFSEQDILKHQSLPDNYAAESVNLTLNHIDIRYLFFLNQQDIEITSLVIDPNETANFYLNRKVRKNLADSLQPFELEKSFFETRKGRLQLIGFFSIFLAIMAIVFIYQFPPIGTIFSNFTNPEVWTTPWIYLLFTNFLFFALFPSAIFFIIFRTYNKKVEFITIYKSFLLSRFITSIMPNFIFGMIFQIWYLRKKGLNSSQIVPTVALYMISMGLWEIFWLLIFLPIGIHNLGQNPNISESAYYTIMVAAIFGFFWISFNITFYIFIAFSIWLHNWILYFVENIFFRLKMYHRYNHFYNELDFNARQTRKNILYFTKKPLLFLEIGAIVFAIFFYYGLLLMAAINIVLINNPDPLIEPIKFSSIIIVLALDRVVILANIISFVPGQAGTTELTFNTIIAAYFPMLTRNDIESMTAINRIFTYYGLVLLNAIYFGIMIYRIPKREKAIQLQKKLLELPQK